MIRNHSRHGSRFPVTSTSAPGAPTIGTATATGSTTATVSFTQPASDGGSTITSYTATSSPGGITGVLNQAGSGTITVTGLTASTSYTFTVTATNAIGTRAPSGASNSITTYAAITKSLRFRSSASAYLNRTPATTTNQKTWTWSAWVKRGILGGAAGQEFFTAEVSATAYNILYFTNANALSVLEYKLPTGSVAQLITTQVFRDPAAWYHIVLAWDSTQATASNRIKLYVNGTQITAFSTETYQSQNDDSYVNLSSAVHVMGRYNSIPSEYFDGELAEVNFVDGQALAPASFGATGANSQWLPKAYTGTYGTNGFYLPFSNTTSTSTLVADSSGNGNNWTPNNISLTAGITYDSLTDVPTLTSATVANYAVLNPLDSGMVLSNVNLTTTTGSAANTIVRATIGVTSGKWYWEVTQSTANEVLVGVANSSASLAQYLGQNVNGWAYDSGNGQKYNNGVGSAYGATWTTNDVIGIALDMTAGTIVFYKNNTSQGTAFTGLTGTLFPAVSAGVASTAMTINFGQQPFVYTPPTGFVALNTYNLPAGTVTTSGTFTGNLSTDGPFVFLNGTPTTMTINGNAVTFGTQADKLANGFKVRSSSASYNASGSNTYTASVVGAVFKYEDAQSNP